MEGLSGISDRRCHSACGVRRLGCRRDAAVSVTMKETRQQRRARERTEAKAVNRPGPNPPSQPTPSPATDPIGTIASDDVVEVTLTRMVENAPEGFTEDSDDSGTFWHTEWAVRDGIWSIGGDSDEDLETAVREVVDQIRLASPGAGVPIEWDITGDRVDGQSPEAAVAAAGVPLPTST